VFAGGLALWLPSGPLGHGWAERSGTPATLGSSTQKVDAPAPQQDSASVALKGRA
jgi:hypothetical protein